MQMLNLLEAMTTRYGVRISTIILVLVAIFTATLYDYLYYSVVQGIDMYPGWFYSDLLIATAVGGPVIWLLLSLTARSLKQQHELNAALGRVRELQSILPMCAGCKKIRDEQGQWQDADNYIRDHTNSQVSHGFCPDCQRDLCQ